MSRWLEGLTYSGPYMLERSPNAKDLLAAYQEGRGKPPTPQLSSIWNRMPVHILKLALLYHVSLYRGGDEPLRADVVEMAIHFLHDYVLPGHRWVMERLERTNDPIQDVEMRILMALESERASGIRLTEFYGGFGARYKVRDAMANLYGRGRISFWTVPTGGRPATYVTLGNESPRSGARRATPTFLDKIEAEEGLDENANPDLFEDSSNNDDDLPF